MMSEIQIGVVYNWSTYDQDCNNEPLTLMVEGSREKDGPAEWRVLLQPLKDDGFSMNSITVYGFSFADSSSVVSSGGENSLETVLDKIGCKEARYLSFRFRKPVMACMDQSLFVSQVSKSKSYGISFVSVMGNQVPEQEHFFNYLMDIQKENSLEVLSKFFSSEFTEAFEIISDQP